MNAQEVNALLAKAAMVDPRAKRLAPLEAADQAEAWAEALQDIDLKDALEALRIHQRDSAEVVKPFHIVQGVKAIVADYNHRQASKLEVEHHRGWHPAPSREVMDLIGTAEKANDPVCVARFKTAYRDELVAAGFDPDAPRPGMPRTVPSWDGHGQGKDFAIPVGDR